MPSSKRTDPDDFFERLEEHQKPHLEQLRRISREYLDEVTEELRWNHPTYLRDGKNQWMLQAFKNHCSLRFTPVFFGEYIDVVEAAGYEAGAGFLKIPYTEEVPESLCRELIEAQLAAE